MHAVRLVKMIFVSGCVWNFVMTFSAISDLKGIFINRRERPVVTCKFIREEAHSEETKDYFARLNLDHARGLRLDS